MARKPKPPRLKIIEGNPGRRPINPGLQLPPGAPAEPDWSKVLPGKSPVPRRDAKAEWQRVVPELDRMGLLAHVDRALLVDYCVCWASLLECVRRVSKEGQVVLMTGSQGQQILKPNPHATLAHQYRQSLKNYCAELGLGPSSRGRLNVPGTDEQDDAEQAVFSS